MSTQSIVSVIIIFKNEERFLRDAIESVLAQTYQHWELILVDDASTDKSTQIAQEYQERLPEKVRYLTHPNFENRGMSASRNLGIKNATGTYISYVDGDDLWLPNKLEDQVAILSKNPEAAMVYGPVKSWYSWTGKQEDQDKDYMIGLTSGNIVLQGNQLIQPPDLVALFIIHENLIPTGTMMLRQAILDVGGSVNSFEGNYEDVALLTKICLQYPAYIADECWYIYRQHPDSCTAIEGKAGLELKSKLLFLSWAESYLNEQKIIDKKVRKAIRSARFHARYPGLRKCLEFSRIVLGAIKHRNLETLRNHMASDSPH